MSRGLYISDSHPGYLAQWGLLGPLHTQSDRRTRHLGVASVVREFNDLAVPGLGGIWFGKSMVLAVLGIEVATATGRRNIEVANAIEALACWLALNARNWSRHARVRGSAKLYGRAREDLLYKKVSRPGFYVTQPMRQQTIQPLVALGLVHADGERFNSFTLSEDGRALLSDAFDGYKPYRSSVLDVLIGWVAEGKDVVSSTLHNALSPLEPLSEAARSRLWELLVRGSSMESMRRARALEWVVSVADRGDDNSDWGNRPGMIERDHWNDLRAGARFFALRDCVVSVLEQAEQVIAATRDARIDAGRPLPVALADILKELRAKAATFMNESLALRTRKEAVDFGRACCEANDGRLLSSLVERDGQGLRMDGAAVVAGPAFRGVSKETVSESRALEDEGAEVPVDEAPVWPKSISYRINNLFLLSNDLRGSRNTEDSNETRGFA